MLTGTCRAAYPNATYALPGLTAYLLAGRPGWLLPIGLAWLLWETAHCFRTGASGVLCLLRPIALLTMWVAPAASYILTDTAWYTGYRLWAPPEAYFRLAAPGTAALLWGLRAAEWLPTRHPGRMPKAPRAFFWFLVSGGLSAQALLPFMEGYLRYPAYLCSLLLWPALMLGMQLWPLRRWILVLGGGIWALLLAIQSAFFGSGLLGTLALWLRARAGAGPTWRDRAVLGGFALLILFLISFKYDYREQKAAHPDATGLFFQMARDKLRHPANIFHPEVLSRALSRLNQGFHTAQALAYVPSKIPFVCGETLVNDLWGALVPRCVFPNKPRADGLDKLRRFAGQAHYRICANIGVYGEAYVNFGAAGGWLVLGMYGLLLGMLWALSRQYLGAYWGPYLFLPAVHVESDLGIVLNHISKSALVAIVITLFWHGLTDLRRRTHL